MTPDDRELSFIIDIANELKDIGDFVRGKSFAVFLSDKLLHKAVTRSLETIGEAVKNLLPRTKHRYPDIPWANIAKFRDKVIHHYWEIDYAQIWDIATGPYLASLLAVVAAELKERRD